MILGKRGAVIDERETTWPSRRLVLHVGAHKTGMTAIQNGLREYASYLRLQGIAVFVGRFLKPFISAITPGFHGLTFRDINLDRVWRDFDAHMLVPEAHTIVVSNEEMTKTWDRVAEIVF